MSAPDYDDPTSKLKLRLRPMAGSETITAWGAVLSGIAACLCVCVLVVSLFPGVQVDGNRLWLLVSAVVFGGGSYVFYWAHKLVRRLR